MESMVSALQGDWMTEQPTTPSRRFPAGLNPGRGDQNYTTDRCRAMQVCNTSSIGFSHHWLEKISISE
jgi:hypothetical protein